MKRILYALLILASGCTGLFFYPHGNKVSEPSMFGLAFSEQVLSDGDGPNLIFWDLPPAGPYRGTVLFLHGNAGNISTHIQSVAWLPERGYRVLIFDYRGYGGSAGIPEVRGMHYDAMRMFRYICDQEPDPQRRILFGQSLGASIALYAANTYGKDYPFRVIIADSPFASYRELAREKLASYWISYPLQVPLSWLVSDEYAPVRNVRDVRVPVLLLHGEKDDTVPAHHSAQVCAALGSYCTRWEIPEVPHIYALTRRDIREKTLGWMEQTPAHQ